MNEEPQPLLRHKLLAVLDIDALLGRLPQANALEGLDAVVGSEAVGSAGFFAMLYGAGFRNIHSTESDLDASELSWKQNGIEHTCATANQLIVAPFHAIHRIVDHAI